MSDISRQRCYNHQSREAAARCLECGRSYCRECVTEHDDKVMCSECLKNQTSALKEKKKRFGNVFRLIFFAINIIFLWITFYYLGRSLLKIPASFHDGTIWKSLL